MSRTRAIPPVPEHIDPEREDAQLARKVGRQQNKGSVTPATLAQCDPHAIARVLGTKKKEDGDE